MGWFCVLRIVGSDLHHRGGQVGAEPCGAVSLSDAGVAGVDVGPAVLAAEHGPFGEYSQPVKGGRTGNTHHRIRQNPVVEGYVDAVVVAVKGHRFHIDGGVEQLRTADLCADAGIQQRLGAGG